ncbi:MAG: hypothetical protein QM722_22735 [Piscinibacter sp.]
MLFTLVMLAFLVTPGVWLYCKYFAAVEIALTSTAVWLAWTWPREQPGPLQRGWHHARHAALPALIVNIRPTPLTAAIAGVVAAVAWPFLWARWGGPGDAGGFELIVATLLVIALPAHAFVVGFARPQADSARSLDTALLKRIGAWLAAAAGCTVLRAAAGL